MSKKHRITVAEGDGIGPEIMEATLNILEASGAEIEIEKISVGEKVYLGGHSLGIEESAWETLIRNRVFLKAPITTPQGGGYRSLNVAIRTTLGLYANIRPCVSYHPLIETKHPKMNVVIIRENEEDLYVGIEYRQTPDMYQALKLISQPGSERIIRYAFEYARLYKRKKVTAFTKDNILKMSDGLFHRLFDEIAQEYPDIEHEHWIIDIGSAKLADTPENFDVIVMANLYGDIVSDIAAQITRSVGLVGTANIGEKGAMFEAIHGSAPRLAGQNSANPTGLILASVLMLVHIHQPKIAANIHNAWLKTIEEGLHTRDICKKGTPIGTKEFAKAVMKRLGKKPDTMQAIEYLSVKDQTFTHPQKTASLRIERKLIGVDIYLYFDGSIESLLKRIKKVEAPSMRLLAITNRGVQIWPAKKMGVFCVDHWRCRFESHNNTAIEIQSISSLLNSFAHEKLETIKTENLYMFNGLRAYSAI
ncbi:MAG: NADP-dependent isocitrate dehydrogenase [Chlamydiales bacterium]